MVRISQADLDAFQGRQAPRPSKYRNQRVELDHQRFDSLKEAKRYTGLKLLRKAGEVVWFTRQVPFWLDGGTKYVADFLVVWADGRVTVEDCKGMRTQTYVVKKREVEAKFGFRIQEL